MIYFLPTDAGPVRSDFLMSHFKALWVPHNISDDIRRLYWDKQAGKLTHHLITPLPSFPCLPPLFCIRRLSHFCILLQEIIPQFLVTTSRGGGRDLICWFLQQQLCFDFLLYVKYVAHCVASCCSCVAQVPLSLTTLHWWESFIHCRALLLFNLKPINLGKCLFNECQTHYMNSAVIAKDLKNGDVVEFAYR